jgi:hypothetical protein
MSVDEAREKKLHGSENGTWCRFEGGVFLVDIGERFDRVVEK